MVFEPSIKALSVMAIISLVVVTIALAIGLAALVLVETKKSLTDIDVLQTENVKNVTTANQYLTGTILGDYVLENTILPSAGTVFGNSTPETFARIDHSGITVPTGNVDVSTGNVTVSTGNIVVSTGDVSIVSGSLRLPAPGGTVTPISYNEDAGFTSTVSGAWIGSASFIFTRFGNDVTMFGTRKFAASTADGDLLLDIAIPTRFRPLSTLNFTILGSNANVITLVDTQVSVTTNGFIAFTGPAGAIFNTGRSNVGWASFSICWNITQ